MLVTAVISTQFRIVFNGGVVLVIYALIRIPSCIILTDGNSCIQMYD